MLVVSRFRVPVEEGETSRTELAAAHAVLAERLGYVDGTVGRNLDDHRPRDLQHATFPQLRGYCLANYFSDPVFRSKLAAPGSSSGGAASFERNTGSEK